MDVASSQYEFGFFVSDFGWQSKISTLTGGLDDIDRASDAHAVHRRRLPRPSGTSRARRRRRGLGRSARHAGTRPGTGHGIRVTTHEPPYIVEGEEQLLVPGMCFSIEPGIYLEGRFGIRIDDIVTVTEDGGRRLNNTSHDLRVVD
ncbi:M24 family metallopeptidase [Rhodococcus sp. T2V]|uniref:M24 family metallopeptidase n=1 Tax=Rhodococcus sp. T2V TaxID=3034164 RepID=UPI0023E2F265|nr:M24 family metallopeptidase [Rhodococcus sp. T2V]MDF3311434.1 M24 family metallopeptidase [Rhodococcus sp. T2V]